MRAITFKYLLHHKSYVPVIPLLVKGKSEWQRMLAYVDSGASCSIFSIDEASKLRIDYTKGRRGITMVGDGNFIPVFFHKLNVNIGGIFFKATIAFSPELGVGFNLLGRKDIFDRFEVIFNDPKRIVTFRKIK